MDESDEWGGKVAIFSVSSQGPLAEMTSISRPESWSFLFSKKSPGDRRGGEVGG